MRIWKKSHNRARFQSDITTLSIMPFEEHSFRVPDEIQIINLSLPVQPSSLGEDCEYDQHEPELADLLRAVECPICRCIPNPPIQNCINGHFSCSTCLPRLSITKCGYCSGKFTKMRNYPLENLVTAKVFPCDFRHAGCNARDMSMAEYEVHVQSCWYRSLLLPNENKTTKTFPQEVRNNNKPIEEFSCPRCTFMNSKRKLKCQNCETNLRVPTPICSRSIRHLCNS